jgi:hypothetical protein
LTIHREFREELRRDLLWRPGRRGAVLKKFVNGVEE